MNEDLISDNFTDHVDRGIIKRNFVISKLLMILCIIWSIVLLIDWYRFLQGRNGILIRGRYMIYNYVILPISDVIIIALSVYTYFLILKAYRLIETSLDQSDGTLLSEGFRLFYTTNLLSVISFIISIIMIMLGFLL